ncbi:hypothetical protein DFH08DRAFT_804268 [Mycena albidolilacea]|uniref:Uncharacterized protein n=1 Tax=Mycena albidolilacea TaxID=1033008 RepID=A0AAD7EYB8_9AGAR|nr:hypothetical protein DFH08DRAFT_804268 [Mycena albidolilacea]
MLECAANLTDVYLTLPLASGAWNVDELCSSLPLLNPCHAIVNNVGEPKKSEKITDLLGTLVRVILKWDNCKPSNFRMWYHSLDCLRALELIGRVLSVIAFLKSRGFEVQQLVAPFELLIEANIFNLCTNIDTLKVRRQAKDSQISVLQFMILAGANLVHRPTHSPSEKIMASSTPHGSLARIHFGWATMQVYPYPVLKAPTNVVDVRHIFEQLDPESFPTLKEIKMDNIKWLNSDSSRPAPSLPLAELLMYNRGADCDDALALYFGAKCWTVLSLLVGAGLSSTLHLQMSDVRR